MKVINEMEQSLIKKGVPDFNVGDTVRVTCKIQEGGKERLQAFEGIVLKRQGTKTRETFSVRKIVMGVGVERIFPVNSPLIEKIQVVKSGRVRRAKLYYMRKLKGGAATRIDEVQKEGA
ncbi:MAG TPA: 50S ribosomal protein L19 [Candidatus Omnitrophota bacterium]|nr:50S ribosomal protein L19 [Candidatus Omnitrophota bacterium]